MSARVIHVSVGGRSERLPDDGSKTRCEGTATNGKRCARRAAGAARGAMFVTPLCAKHLDEECGPAMPPVEADEAPSADLHPLEGGRASPAERIARIRADITVDPPASAAVLHMPSAIALLDVAEAAIAFRNSSNTPRDFSTFTADLARLDEALTRLGGR